MTQPARPAAAPTRAPGIALLACLVLPPFLAPAARGEWYLRAAVGIAQSRDTTLRDRDCQATTPPALFGCGVGRDGRRLAADGDFGRSGWYELGAGFALSAPLRAELLLATMADPELAAEANFRNVSGPQPVRADLRSDLVLAALHWDLGRTWSSVSPAVSPFVGGGIGVVRHRLGEVTYAFPGIAADAVTITGDGRRDGLAWMATVGVDAALTPRLRLELAYRYLDLGEVESAAGPATIVRPRGTFVIDVAPTRAELTVHSLVIALRHRL